MKYKITFEYIDVVQDYESEAEITRTSCRYFDNYNDYQDFIQCLDMAGDETTKIINDENISDTKSRIYYALAFMVYALHGYKCRVGKRIFYNLMHSALIETVNNDLCIKFDNAGYKRG